MTKNEMISKLEAGAEVANRGKGWWVITPPSKGMDRVSVPVDQAVVEAACVDGSAKVEYLAHSNRLTKGRPMKLVLN